MKLKRLFLLLVLLLLLAACGNDEEVTPQATAGSPTESASVPTMAATATLMATAIPDRPTTTPTATAPAVPGLTQLYYNEAADFSLWLPNEWVVGEPTDSPLGQMTLVGLQATTQAGASNNTIFVTDADDMTVEELAAALLCGTAGNCESPELQEVTLNNTIPAYFALISGTGQPKLPWYLVERNSNLIAFTMHDTGTLASLEAIVQSLTWGRIVETGTEGFPAARAARFALAQELEVNPYQVVISAVQSAEWPDSCLGVHRIDALCAQVVTPGYQVTAQINGRYYHINTDESGSSLVRVPGAVPPTGGIALTQGSGEQCTAIIFHQESDVQAGFCEGELTNYASDASETATQLNDLIAQYAPFHAQTPAGTINFSGLGDTLADPTIQRQIAELTRFYTDIIISGRASAASQLAFSWNRTGGIAGFCDDLAVYTYGLTLASSCQAEATDNSGQLWLSPEQLAQVYDWVDRFGSFEFDQSDPPNVSDALSLLLVFNGSGPETAATADQQAIADFAAALFAQATGLETAVPSSIPTLHTVTGDAGEVVGAFLAALVEDETGQSSVIYLNQALQQQVSEGQTVPQLLSFSDSLSAYEYTITDNGRGDDTAVVEATLNETNPVTVTFTLTRQNDLWVISQIAQ